MSVRFYGMKSHDCHIFTERLLPVATKDLLPLHVWKGITEISQFYRDLCSSSWRVQDMIQLGKNIPGILCKLEGIFPPSFFNVMEHLPVHLPYEAKVGGPVQYRWMYPVERFLHHLKRKVGNKARVEGSICNAYLMGEISYFSSHYLDSEVDSKVRHLSRNVTEVVAENIDQSVPELFCVTGGRAIGSGEKDFLDDRDYEAAHGYVIGNCEILRDYERVFESKIKSEHPQLSVSEVWSKLGNG